MKHQQSYLRISRGLYKRVSSSGQVYFLTYDGVDEAKKPIWTKHNTQSEAEEHHRQTKIRKINEGQKAWGLTPTQREDAARAIELLNPYPNTKLVHAAAHYVSAILKNQNCKTIKEVVADLMTIKEKANLRPKSLKALRRRLGKLVEAFGERKMSSVTVEEMQNFVDRSGSAPRTKIGFAAVASQLWKFGEKRRWVTENIASLIDRPTPDDNNEIIAFSVDEAQALLNAAVGLKMLPFVALGMFCGVRREELVRLSKLKLYGKAVNLDNRTVTIPAEVAKKRSRRTIDIQHPTLCEWLAPHLKLGLLPGSADDTTVTELLNDLVKKAKVKWVKNGLRHSYATYHLVKFKDVAHLAYYMGEKDANVIFNHYAELRKPEEAEQFWNLRPTV